MITTQKSEILYSLYKFRFLTRKQIQYLLNHKQFNRIIIWLNQLTEQGYIRKYYDNRRVNVPAIYSLGLEGRKYLKRNQAEKINVALLDRVWRESSVSEEFKHHNLFVADCYISLCKLIASTGAMAHFYTKTDLHGLQHLILPNPDAYFSITEVNGRKTCYFLEFINAGMPRMALRKQIRQYIEYYESNEWQEHSKNPFPNIIAICPDKKELTYLKHFIGSVLEESNELLFYLSTKKEIIENGFIKDILHKV